MPSSSEPAPGGFEPVSVAVNEHVAARRLGLSVDTLRRDRRLGHLGIPFIKLGEGKRGLVRYDLQDLDRWLETKKRIGRAPAVQVRAPSEQPIEQERPAAQYQPPAEQGAVHEPEPIVPRRPPPWEVMAERLIVDESPDDPFATAGRAAPRRQGSGYWGH